MSKMNEKTHSICNWKTENSFSNWKTENTMKNGKYNSQSFDINQKCEWSDDN